MGSDYIIPSISVGTPRTVMLMSKDGNDTREISLMSGSLLVQRESVLNHWKITMVQDHSEDLYYDLTFLRVYPVEYIPKECKDVVVNKIKLPYELSRIYLETKYRISFAKKIKKGIG